ncbi:hypothetical protein HOD30_01210 [Candidatus Peregrinibacteria bacterium]|jgi:hypothetical protein|nr:hypothetical protein [Candidatus Peregrinibacteria bacterium]MBT4632277.1 hypothetical protein [Candidatus Peregrinibacteria bacterium]MBT5516617.1 hypothetical protein [Candidatus Peregrinibacteria bacterium]MBT5824312.1 hypothetical protein [Candidatus Peregrinibacteria bacterium]
MKFISILTHPVLIFPILTYIYFDWESTFSFFAVLTMSFIVPFLYFLYLYKSKQISNFDISERKQRYKVYYATLIGLIITGIYLNQFSTPEIFQDYLKLLLIAITLVIVNFKVKVSIHVALITIFCISLFQDFNIHYAIFLLIPLVAYSRTKLKRHKLLEVVLGTIIPALFYL